METFKEIPEQNFYIEETFPFLNKNSSGVSVIFLCKSSDGRKVFEVIVKIIEIELTPSENGFYGTAFVNGEKRYFNYFTDKKNHKGTLFYGDYKDRIKWLF